MHIPRNYIFKRCSIIRQALPLLWRMPLQRKASNPKLAHPELNSNNKLYTNWFGLPDVKQALKTRRYKYNTTWLKMALGLKNRRSTLFKENRLQTRLSHNKNLKKIPSALCNRPIYQTKSTEISVPSSDLRGKAVAYCKQFSEPQKQRAGFYSKVRVQSLVVRARR